MGKDETYEIMSEGVLFYIKDLQINTIKLFEGD